MAGLVVKVNGRLLASVSNADLNLISVYVHGDVIREEFAALEVTGGLYGHGDADKHLIWVNDHEVSRDDEVEISFGEDVSTSHAGRTIDELHPEPSSQDGSGQSIDDLFEELSSRPKVREKFAFELTPPKGEVIRSSTGADDFAFHFSAMWKWTKPEEARVSLASNTLEKIVSRQDGLNHAKLTLQFGEKVTLRIGT